MTEFNIGIINGVGIGPEIMHEAIRVIEVVVKKYGHKINLIEYTGSMPVSEYNGKVYNDIEFFYEKIMNKKGVILRSSIYAAYAYKLRNELNLLYKVIFLKSIPELQDVCILKKEILKDFNILLIRDNSQGPYHGKETLKYTNKGDRQIYVTFDISETKIKKIMDAAFRFASTRNETLHLFIKDHVLQKIGKLWLEILFEIGKEYPNVKVNRTHPDSGLANLLIKPSNFDVIVALDVDADIISDYLAALIHGTRAITPSSNVNPNGFASYQTIHGTALGVPTNSANPIGMILAAAQMLEFSFGLIKESRMILQAIRNVLKMGYRTFDIYNSTLQSQKLIGTKQMGNLIIDELRRYGKK